VPDMLTHTPDAEQPSPEATAAESTPTHVPDEPPAPAGEPRGARLARHARRARMYASAGTFVALLALLVVLASRNTRAAKLDWVIGSTHAALSWIILAAAVFGWLLGITTAAIVRRRTRRTR